MKIIQAGELWLDYHRFNSQKNTVKSYEALLSRFNKDFGERSIENVTTDEILEFLNQITEGRKQQTKRIKYAHLSAFFNFIRANVNTDFRNPCDNPMLKKMFRARPIVSWEIIEKDVIDEIIFTTVKPRNRLILELMARGGMRVGEVLKLRSRDINGRKLTLKDPKSGKEREHVFIPQKVADRLKEYIRDKEIQLNQKIFPICYEAARTMVKKAGDKVGIRLRPHDLRRHAATYASRSGVPIEIVSKVILRHANLSTTQIYLGKVPDTEAMRWIENLYA